MKSHDNTWKKTASIESLEPMVLMSASALGGNDPTENNDVLFANEAGEIVEGLGGDDILLAAAEEQIVRAGDGDDTIVLLGTNSIVDGGNGQDIVVYQDGDRADFDTVQFGDEGVILFRDGQRDILSGVENVRFNDSTYSLADLQGYEEPTTPPEPEPPTPDTRHHHLNTARLMEPTIDCRFRNWAVPMRN